jgi:hypothetical protein
MLSDGTLRFCLEASIEMDHPLIGKADRQSISGSPYLQERIIDSKGRFVKTYDYADGITSPTEMNLLLTDDTADATQYAEMIRYGSEDEAIHASVLTSGDWPRQPLGGIISGVSGRTVNLSSESGVGAQIVAIRTDPNSLKIEYLTQSVALELSARDRRILGSTRLFKGRTGVFDKDRKE